LEFPPEGFKSGLGSKTQKRKSPQNRYGKPPNPLKRALKPSTREESSFRTFAMEKTAARNNNPPNFSPWELMPNWEGPKEGPSSKWFPNEKVSLTLSPMYPNKNRTSFGEL